MEFRKLNLARGSKTVIGMVHCLPLPGTVGFSGDFEKIVHENPFREDYLHDRVHVILYQGLIQSLPLEKLKTDYGEEEICVGDYCLYLYLPRTAKQKKLNTNYLEKLFGVVLTMRKLNVVEKLLTK